MTPPVASQLLPSGRSVEVDAAAGREAITVRAADGALELRIELTPAGPVVRLSAARLEIAAADVAVKCDTFAVDAAAGVRVSAGEFRVKTEESIHLNGATVRLNCTEDAVPPAPPPPTVPLPLVGSPPAE